MGPWWGGLTLSEGTALSEGSVIQAGRDKSGGATGSHCRDRAGSIREHIEIKAHPGQTCLPLSPPLSSLHRTWHPPGAQRETSVRSWAKSCRE